VLFYLSAFLAVPLAKNSATPLELVSLSFRPYIECFSTCRYQIPLPDHAIQATTGKARKRPKTTNFEEFSAT
jgi:hypothetical protein